uniref:Cyclic AMP-responsive element-binding protein 3-like protein 3-B n=1 Tax=Gouania willdenowi TaxID=441366 RepID=A0A8C5NGM5_GOUWI
MTLTSNKALSSESSGADDFLEALLHGSASSSGPASPLWSPCTTDSSINDDLLTDPDDNLHYSPSNAVFPSGFPQHQSAKNTAGNEKNSDVCINLDWEPEGVHEGSGIAYYLTTSRSPLLPSSHSVTVKDLLLSNLGHKAQQIPQHSLQTVVLNEDEKRLLAKEGVNLPNKLPLSKFEERVLKKIRRKIRNKRSAQESRKKKREYVDSLEGRMSAISDHNLELQRKIHNLEETNNVLKEQLSQLQALVPHSSSKPAAHRGACILVLLLSFSLIISSNLQPDSYSQLSQSEHTETKAWSRSLQSVDEVQNAPRAPSPSALSFTKGFEILRSFAETLRPWMELPTAG